MNTSIQARIREGIINWARDETDRRRLRAWLRTNQVPVRRGSSIEELRAAIVKTVRGCCS